MQVFALYGVHGAGKSYIAKPVAEDLGITYVQADAMELKGADVQKLSPFARQSLFILSALAGYVNALDLAQKGRPVLLDFGPYQTDPYIRWWVQQEGEQKRLLDLLYKSTESIESQYRNVDVYHIFFLITRENGIRIVKERIWRRNRPESVKKEESDENYIRFVNDRLLDIADTLKKDGKRVHIIPAELNIRDRLGALWSVVEDVL